MRPRLAALVALVALLAVGLVARRRRREADRGEALRAATRAHTLAAEVSACLLGPRARDPLAHARRVALHPDTPAAWPGTCAAKVRSLAVATARAPALAALSARAQTLARALADPALPAALEGFRDGRAPGAAFAWITAAEALQGADEALARDLRLAPARPALTPRRALPSVTGDVVPAAVAPGATVAGWSAAAGTLSALFIEPTADRVFCRTRDRGVTVACRRLGAAPDAPAWLVANDAPEALLLRPRPTASIAPADALETPVYRLAQPLTPGLVARVLDGGLLAVTDAAGAAALARCPRGSPCATLPLGLPAARESVLVATGPARWWLGVTGPEGALALSARRLDPAGPAAAPLRVASLSSAATLLASCQAAGVAYVAATDGGRSHLFALEGEAAPRALGSVDAVPPPAELLCDARGATLFGATTAQGCERAGGCSALAWTGLRRAARIDGELVTVELTRDGGDGLRARHATPARFAEARASAVDDDAAHGGVSARDLWLFAADGRLVLFASGATTAVLWSDDRGERWQAAREPLAARPMRLGAVR
jgi:hypothetical protein